MQVAAGWGFSGRGRATVPKNTYRNAEGKTLPSVTTILKEKGEDPGGLMHWAWKIGTEGGDYRDERGRAASIGTVAHRGVENDIRGLPFDVEAMRDVWDDEAVDCVVRALEAWAAWKERTRMKPIITELMDVSERLQYGGQLDIVAMINGKRAVVDLKATNALHAKNICQTRAYGYIWDEKHPDEPIEEYHLLRLGKEDAAFHHSYYDRHSPTIRVAMLTWLNCRENYMLNRPLGGGPFQRDWERLWWAIMDERVKVGPVRPDELAQEMEERGFHKGPSF